MTQGMLLLACCGTVAAWLITGHWILNNLLGISICVAFVSHVRLPNIKICAILLVCLFVYDLFWVFYSERFFGANVMVSVATQRASNPVRTVANSLSLPGLQLITKKLEMPVKIMFPSHLLGGVLPGTTDADFMMLGLGDMVLSVTPVMAIPAMLLALILCFVYRKSREIVSLMDLHSSKRQKYIWYASRRSPDSFTSASSPLSGNLNIQSNILTLIFWLVFMVHLSWMRRELSELWEGNPPSTNDKDSSAEV